MFWDEPSFGGWDSISPEAFSQSGFYGGGSYYGAPIGSGGTTPVAGINIPIPGGGSASLNLGALVSGLTGAAGGSHQPDVNEATTQVVNGAEVILKQNLAAWSAGTKSRAEALAVYDQTMQQMGQILAQYGEVGQKALSERVRGNSLSRFDWQGWYRDPISTGTMTITDQISAITETAVTPIWLWLGIGGLIVWLLARRSGA